ncbi:hypothetical protein BC749_107238 [Flavobacterium araucananum]|uniref:Uncharacterized protein n=1 Tax=Flavobacterium araucananum TaxID=946678 RepID=A0A227PAT4_9FLAO|nr:DUF6544 family protein [Flavobacterium araucananum]OXG07019.1 hypothetical protein B0A64_09370 [Flavobacterium araucananum]PWJ97437.1 hypothetical protein BC749_107238 [Flavobacterium araucananum]
MKLLLIIGAVLLVILLGKITMSLKFKKQVKTLYANALNVSDKRYNPGQLIGLPKPVQRYFKYVLKDTMPYIVSVRLKHKGVFKTSLKSGFINIRGEQYFSVQKPQFIWKGSTLIFTARDSLIADKGNLKVSLFNIFTVVDGKGTGINEGEMQRWLAESVWFPTNLLPSENITWIAIDENSAKLSFRYKEISFDFIVIFNAVGEIVTMETLRFMTGQKREPWLCRMTNYKDINGVKIPFSAEAVWKLKTGDFSYAKFKVTAVQYNQNIPKRIL